MTGRILLIPALLIGLSLVLGPGREPAQRPTDANPADPDAATPIVAIRGEPLAPYEEPLPPGARVRIGSTRFRHPTALNGQNATLVGRYLVTLRDEEFTLTDTVTGRRVLTQSAELAHGWRVSAAGHSSGFLAIWTRFPEGSAPARLWRVNSDLERPLTPIGPLHLPAGVEGRYISYVTFGDDGRDLILVANDAIVRCDPATGQPRAFVPHQYTILSVSADGRRFFGAEGRDPRFVLRHGGFGRLGTLPNYRFQPPTPDGKPEPETPDRAEGPPPKTEPLVLVVGDTRSGELVERLTIPRVVNEPVPHSDLSPDGRHLSYGLGSAVFVWDAERHRQVLRAQFGNAGNTIHRGSFDHCWFLADGRRFATEDSAGTRRLFDLGSGLEISGPVDAAPRRSFLGEEVHGDLITDDGNIRRHAGRHPLPPGYSGVRVDCSPDGRLIAIGDATGRLDVWRPDGKLVRTLLTGGKGVIALSFAPDGLRLASCDKGRTVCIWSLAGGWVRDRFVVPVDDEGLYPEHLTFSPDGRRLLVSRGDILALWDISARTWVWDVPGYDLWSNSRPPVFSPDGSRIAVNGGLEWIDAATGEPSWPAAKGDGVERRLPRLSPRPRFWRSHGSARAVFPDGQLHAIVDDYGLLQVQNLESGQVVQTFPESSAVAHRDSFVRFSPDGRRLVTCDDQGRVRVWEVATGQLAFTLTYPDGAIHDAHFSRDGRSLITANHREVIVWDLSPEPGACTDAWADLGHEAPRAEQARRTLLADPTGAVALLRKHPQPAALLNEADVRRLIRALDADDYRHRQRAGAALVGLGRRVLPRLKEAKPTSEEGAARLAAVIRDLSAGLTAGERREVRGIEVLEQIGTPAARALITHLATGDPAAVLTEEATKSLRVSNRVVSPSPGRQAGRALPGRGLTTATTASPTPTGSRVAPTGGLGSPSRAWTTD